MFRHFVVYHVLVSPSKLDIAGKRKNKRCVSTSSLYRPPIPMDIVYTWIDKLTAEGEKTEKFVHYSDGNKIVSFYFP